MLGREVAVRAGPIGPGETNGASAFRTVGREGGAPLAIISPDPDRIPMLALLLLSVALAMDALAVALVQGAITRCGLPGAIRLGLAFGGAQGAMAGIGWAVGALAERWIAPVDHWVAFALLGILGIRMIRAGLEPGEGDAPALLGGGALLAAALATSIDAAAAGVTLPLLGFSAIVSLAAVGVTTALISFAGTLAGARLGQRFGKGAEIAGGAVLILLGTRILIEHLIAG